MGKNKVNTYRLAWERTAYSRAQNNTDLVACQLPVGSDEKAHATLPSS